MIIDIVKGISVPFLGTTLGAFCVFFLKNELSKGMQKALTGFAAGVMVAASIWSLLLPALEQGASLGMWKFLPAVIGFWIGILFLMAIDYFAPPECIDEKCKNKLLLAVTLHNIPEGMAVGVIYAGLLSGAEHITEIGAFSLALGIAIQNFPEGAIISLPLCTEGMSKKRAFIYGVLSGAVEPVAAVFTVWADKPYRSASAILFKFCGRGNVLCCSGRTYPGNVCWKTQQYWNDIIFLWIYTNADA